MKKALLALTIAAMVSGQVLAATKYWDINGTTAGSSGGTTATGTWNGTATNFNTDSTGGGAGAISAWSGTTDTAIIAAGSNATGAYTITVDNTQTAAGLSIEEGTITITNGLSPGTVDVLTGTVTLAGGTSLITNSSSRIAVSPGGKYQLNGSALLRTTNTGNLGSFIDADATVLLTSNAVLTEDYQVTAPVGTAPMSIHQTASVISGSGSFVKTGGGILGIASANTYSGSTTIQAGELRMRNTTNRLPVATDLIINGTGIYNMAGLSQTVGSLSGNGGSIGFAGATLTINGSTSTTYDGLLKDTSFIAAATAGGTSGVGRIVKQGSSTLTLTAVNTITGSVTLTAGGITVTAAGSLCGDVADLTVNGGTLTLNNAVEAVENFSGTGGTVNLAPSILTVDPVASGTYSGTIMGAGGLIKQNELSVATIRTTTLSGANSYTGNTIIEGGIISVQNATALGTAAGYTEVNATGVNGHGAELLFTGAGGSVTTSEPLRIKGTGAGDNGAIAVIATATPTLSGPVTLIGDASVTVSSSSGVTFNNVNSFTSLANENLTLRGGSGAGAGGLITGVVNLGAGSLTKLEGGKWVLQGNNTYTGGTTISAGTLLANNTTGSATGSGPVTVNGGTLGGTGSVSGTVTVNAGGTLSPGASIESLGTGSLTFNASATVASTLTYEIGPLTTADLVNAALGSLTIADPTTTFGATLSLVSAGAPTAFPDGTKYTVIAYNGTWNGKAFNNAPNGGTILFGSQVFRVRYQDTTPGGNFATETSSLSNPDITASSRFVTLTAVPELGSFLTMGLIGCCAVFAVRLGKRYGFKALSL